MYGLMRVDAANNMEFSQTITQEIPRMDVKDNYSH